MPTTVYLFEAKSIQTYLFEGGKLRDMVAASNQLDALCKTPLDKVLDTLNLVEGQDIHFSRRAGGAIYSVLKNEQNAHQLQSLWSLYVRREFPSIELVQAICTGDDIVTAMQMGIEKLSVERNRLTSNFPIPGPLAMRSPRTGNAAIQFNHSRSEWVDESTSLKIGYEKKNKAETLVRKFAPNIDPLHWPNNLENDEDKRAFPFLKDDRTIALIHADGNGLGEILRVVNNTARAIYEKTNNADDYINIYQKFSNGLESAVIHAAQVATEKHLKPFGINEILPARPLVLGGDDITLIVRADLAIPFTQAFCLEFEKAAKLEMESLKELLINKLKEQKAEFEKLTNLTACAGICFIKANQPFSQAHHLAESLCALAKKKSKAMPQENGRIPSSLSFHKVSGSLIEDADKVRQHEWSIKNKNQDFNLSLEVYSIGDEFNPLLGLLELGGLFGEGKLNRNALRETASLLKTDINLAKKRYQRWREVSNKTQGTNRENLLLEFDRVMANLCKEYTPFSELPFGIDHHSPLVDLLAITSLTTNHDSLDAKEA